MQVYSIASADEAAEHDAFHRLLAAPSRDPARVAPTRPLVSAVRRSNRFSFLLWSAFGETGNFVVSPYSIRAALGFVYLALGGKDRSRLQSRLAYPARPEDLDLRTLDEAVRAEGAGRFESASSLWVADIDRLQPSYVQAAADYLPGELHAIDFHADPNRARRSINAWASDRSRGELIGPFPETTITAQVESALVSTGSFSGGWPSNVGPDSFKPYPFDVIQVEMMYSENCRAMFQTSVQAATVDYPGTTLSLMVVKPRWWKAFAWNEAAFARLWAALSRAKETGLAIPTFELSSVRDLKPPLMRMGIPISDHSRSFLQAVVDPNIYKTSLDRIVHQAFFQVDAIPIGPSQYDKMIQRLFERRLPMELEGLWPLGEERPGGPMLYLERIPSGYHVRRLEEVRPQRRWLFVDAAFYFLVVNKETGLILLMGQVVDPEVGTRN
jgi:serine protease inhibitor